MENQMEKFQKTLDFPWLIKYNSYRGTESW